MKTLLCFFFGVNERTFETQPVEKPVLLNSHRIDAPAEFVRMRGGRDIG